MGYAAELLIGWILIAISVAIVAYWLVIGYPTIERRLQREAVDIENERKM